MVTVMVSSTANQGKSTVALIIEDALQKAGISFSYEEDDLEMQERTLEFVKRTEKNIAEDKIKDYGLEVNLVEVNLSTLQELKESIKGR